MNDKDQKRCKVGELRPSQALTTFGVGAIIDLPNLSVMVMGLEDWPVKDTVEIGEQRLLASVREVLGHQLKALRSAPVVADTYQVNQFDASALVGIPVAPFPRWMVCPYCRRLAPLNSGLFKLETPYRTDQIRYVHANCSKSGKPPTVVPARFVVACKNGHLDDFPWRAFVHDGPTDCKGGLRLLEPSATGEAASIFVQCEGANCGAIRPMSDAFKMDRMALPVCGARRPHLRDHDEEGCKQPNGQDMRMEPMLQGASNSWFGITLTALAIPQETGKLKQLVEDNWTTLEKVQSEQNIELLLSISQLRDLSEYTPAEIWLAVQAMKNAMPDDSGEPSDLKTPEWEVFIDPDSVAKSRDFHQVARPAKPAIERMASRRLCLQNVFEKCGRWLASPASSRRAITTIQPHFPRSSGPDSLGRHRRGFRPRRFVARGCSFTSRKMLSRSG